MLRFFSIMEIVHCRSNLILLLWLMTHAAIGISDTTPSTGPIQSTVKHRLNSSLTQQDESSLIAGASRLESKNQSTIPLNKARSVDRGKFQAIKDTILGYMGSKAYKPDTKNGPLLGNPNKNARNTSKGQNARNRTLALSKVKKPKVRPSENIYPDGDNLPLEATTKGKKSNVDSGTEDTKVAEALENTSRESADGKSLNGKAGYGSTDGKRGKAKNVSTTKAENAASRLPILDANHTSTLPAIKTSTGLLRENKTARVKEPGPDSIDDSSTVSKSEPQSNLKSDTRGESKSDSGDASKSDPRDESKADPRDESKSDPRDESKADPRDESKSESQGESKSESRGESKSDTRGESAHSLPESKSSDSSSDSKDDSRPKSKGAKPGYGSKSESVNNGNRSARSKSKGGSRGKAKNADSGDDSTVEPILVSRQPDGESGKVDDKSRRFERKGYSQGVSRRHPKKDTSAKLEKSSNLTTFRTENVSLIILKNTSVISPTVDPHAETKFPAEFKVDPSLDSNDSKNDSQSPDKLRTDDGSLRRESKKGSTSELKNGSPPDSINFSAASSDAKMRSSTSTNPKTKMNSDSKTLISNPEPKDDSSSSSKKDSSEDSRVEPRDEYKGNSRGDFKGDSRDDSKGDSRGDSKETSGDESKAESRGDTKGDSRDESKNESKDDSKGDTKVESRDDSKTDSREEPKGDPRGESKGEPQVDSKGELKGDSRDETGADSRAKTPETVVSTLMATASTTKSSPPQKPQPPVVPAMDVEERDYAADNSGEASVLRPQPPPPHTRRPVAGSKPKSRGEDRQLSLDSIPDAGFVKLPVNSSVGASYGSLLAYFVLMMLTVGVLYVVCHRKQKIIACLLEGRRQSSRTARRSGSRQTSGSGYKPLPTEQDLPQVPHEKPDSVQKFVF